MKVKVIIAVLIWAFLSPPVLAQSARDYYQNGYIRFSRGDYQGALEAYQKAVELDPQFWDAHYWVGKVYEQLGNIPEAVAAWRRILIAQPLHNDAFQKWRAYVGTVRVSAEERERWKESFFYQNPPPAVGREEAWTRLVPYALGLMGERDLESLRLAGAILRWAGRNVSALLAPYERVSYRRALQVLRDDILVADAYTVYEFLQECLTRFGDDQEIIGLVNDVQRSIFVTSAQISPEREGETIGIEFRAYDDRVEKEVLNTLESSAAPRMEFYLREHGAEGGS